MNRRTFLNKIISDYNIKLGLAEKKDKSNIFRALLQLRD